MSEQATSLRAAALLAAGLLAAAVLSFPSPRPQDDQTCLACHGDKGLKSGSGGAVYVNGDVYGASVHGQAGVGCVGCHRDLRGVTDFPHARRLAAVTCADCHADYARATTADVHGTWSPRLAAKPVRCADCHGRHDIRPSAEPGSRVSAANRPATCGRCHPGAGIHFAEGRVHEAAGSTALAPHGVVRVLYKALIALMGAGFLAYIAADLIGRRRRR